MTDADGGGPAPTERRAGGRWERWRARCAAPVSATTGAPLGHAVRPDARQAQSRRRRHLHRPSPTGCAAPGPPRSLARPVRRGRRLPRPGGSALVVSWRWSRSVGGATPARVGAQPAPASFRRDSVALRPPAEHRRAGGAGRAPRVRHLHHCDLDLRGGGSVAGGPPVISSLSPSSGTAGQGIQVAGANFLSANGQIVATFNGQVAPTSCPAQNTCTRDRASDAPAGDSVRSYHDGERRRRTP